MTRKRHFSDTLRHHPELARAATPRRMADLPRHRWFYFPHSYDPDLVNAILDQMKVKAGARLLDPYVGAGTSLAVARERRCSAEGLDISPLSVLASNVKARDYDGAALRRCLEQIVGGGPNDEPPIDDLSWRLKKAFSGGELRNILWLTGKIQALETDHREFFLLVLVRAAGAFSRAVPDGGWFRWTTKEEAPDEVIPAFKRQAEITIRDAEVTAIEGTALTWKARLGDARTDLPTGGFTGAISSPPYPNRHDYTRVFHIELLLLGSTEAEIFGLRHRSMRSHVEARRQGEAGTAFQSPPSLTKAMEKWPQDGDHRVHSMLVGYFEDLQLTLVGLRKALEPGSRAALVLGNVQHAGVHIQVDKICAELGETAGLTYERTWVIRQRGNSAQQMSVYGRRPSRESVVFFRRGP